jgi:hypothetical protein
MGAERPGWVRVGVGMYSCETYCAISGSRPVAILYDSQSFSPPLPTATLHMSRTAESKGRRAQSDTASVGRAM